MVIFFILESVTTFRVKVDRFGRGDHLLTVKNYSLSLFVYNHFSSIFAADGAFPLPGGANHLQEYFQIEGLWVSTFGSFHWVFDEG